MMEVIMDCILISNNDTDFMNYEKMVKTMGCDSGAFRDLNLNYITYKDKPYRAMDILNQFHSENGLANENKKFSLSDILPLSIATIGTLLNKNEINFDYIQSFDQQKEQLKEKLLKGDILTVVITTTFYVSINPIVEIIQFIKKYNSKVKIVVGGPFIYSQTLINDEETLGYIFQALGADFYIVSMEGEYALSNIIKEVKTNQNYNSIDNIYYLDNGEYIKTGVSQEDNKLKENLIDWSLFGDKGELVYLRTSKSCPFNCSFCGFPQRAGKYRYVDIEVVENMLDEIAKVGTVKSVHFIDDTFNIPNERFKDILKMMIRKKYDFKWSSFLRCQFVDDETVKLMKESGCEGVFLGIESGSDIILKNMNKQVRKSDFLRGIELLHKYDITFLENFIIGFPGETDETVQETLDFIKETKPPFYRVQLWYCDPITPIYKEKEKYRINGTQFGWEHSTMDYKKACDWIDHIVLNIDKSIWLPQNSFDVDAIYYLQKKGMSLSQIKEFLKAFEALIKEKIKFPRKGEPDHSLIENLRKASLF